MGRRAKPVEPGARFGALVVIEQASSAPDGALRMLCRCDCGVLTNPRKNALFLGRTLSCGAPGCKEWRNPRGPRAAVERTGERYGSLVVLERVPPLSLVQWLCRCDCGETMVLNSQKRALAKLRAKRNKPTHRCARAA